MSSNNDPTYATPIPSSLPSRLGRAYTRHGHPDFTITYGIFSPTEHSFAAHSTVLQDSSTEFGRRFDSGEWIAGGTYPLCPNGDTDDGAFADTQVVELMLEYCYMRSYTLFDPPTRTPFPDHAGGYIRQHYLAHHINSYLDIDGLGKFALTALAELVNNTLAIEEAHITDRLAFLTYAAGMQYTDYGQGVDGNPNQIMGEEVLRDGGYVSNTNAALCEGAARLWAQLGKIDEDGPGRKEIRFTIKRLCCAWPWFGSELSVYLLERGARVKLGKGFDGNHRVSSIRSSLYTRTSLEDPDTHKVRQIIPKQSERRPDPLSSQIAITPGHPCNQHTLEEPYASLLKLHQENQDVEKVQKIMEKLDEKAKKERRLNREKVGEVIEEIQKRAVEEERLQKESREEMEARLRTERPMPPIVRG
ncbi:hypothetical protein EK21DRAFT_88592 [Setomelanomma holmii]|uniref:BTB domain-containing protein n=1 Tax=Setomelanomma holmii TaxID=210430 RepID=A0A9P4HC38_9PLEO|nr:hypothetical protein EK21DRAFT_88592 [Setomelanomma holmii]